MFLENIVNDDLKILSTKIRAMIIKKKYRFLINNTKLSSKLELQIRSCKKKELLLWKINIESKLRQKSYEQLKL